MPFGTREGRQKTIDDFKSGRVKLIYLSPKHCTQGLNLQCVTHVIFYEPVDDPQDEKQIIARTVRLGQTKTVKIVKLICGNTMEDDPRFR